ncbi:MAG: response regulator, partial [Huintestinicola sp.]
NGESILEDVRERKSTAHFTAPKARVLVVDDNLINLKVAVGLMRPYHMQVITADSGRSAVSLLRSKDIDLVFMDHMMPEMDGVETTHAIRAMGGEYYEKLPIIALTANAANGARESLLAAGLDDFVAKPIELAALDRVLRTWLPRELIVSSTSNRRSFAAEGRVPKPTKAAEEPVKKEPAEEKAVSKPQTSELFDTKTGCFYTGGDEDAYKEILEMYVRKFPEKKKLISELYREKNWKNYIIEVHALKSTSLTIGSKPLSELAKKLEFAGKEEKYDIIDAENDDLLKMYEQVAELGCGYLGIDKDMGRTGEPIEQPAEELEDIDSAKLDELIKNVTEACGNFDGDAVDAVCSEAEKLSFGGKALKPYFDEVKAAADDFEYDEASKKAEDIPGKLKKGE